MSANDVLLVMRNDGVLLPVYRGALDQAEGWPWAIKRLYAGSLVVSLEGTATMTDVRILGPTGNSALSRILSVLNSNWNISVRLNDTKMGLSDIVNAISHGLRTNVVARKALFDLPESELLERIDLAGSIGELFNSLGVAHPEFVALDML